MPAVDPARPPARTVVVLGMLSMFGPLSLDLYLPALPELADDLDASASAAQLSITACLVGLAVGQLVAGPLSDRLGRRRPLIVGLVGFMLASVACALAPSAAILVVLRFVQGLAGAAGLVISRAIARDLYSGRALMIFFSRLILIAGLAPVIAPILGGQLSLIMSWRGIFGVLAGFGAVLLLAGWLGLKETLPPERRIVGGFGKTLHGYNTLLHDRFFVGCALSSGLAGASMFAYISGSTFVLQRIYGMSPQGFSFVFGAISLALVIAAQVGGRLALRWPLTRVLGFGLAVNLCGAASLLATVIIGLPLGVLIAALSVMVSAVGLIFPTANALALADYPDLAGTASSLQGLSQFVFGAVAAPLVGIAGERTALPLGIVTTTASLCAIASFAGLVIPVVRARMSR
ncbi:MAG: putative drug resistance transporter [Propionibacteriaceae bacterium]|jgi:DHA1 family bicyclomycin/chloramphenicol resistance-like MFS transporter|nr:putative drug resistance transporter [Propionibacteriaceae bacterium]